MKINSTFHVFVFLIAGLTFSKPFVIFAQQNLVQTETKSSDTVLLIGTHQGIDETDVQTSALLVALEFLFSF